VFWPDFLHLKFGAKAAHKMLLKLTTGFNFTNILHLPFHSKLYFEDLLYSQFGLVIFCQYLRNPTCKMLVKFTLCCLMWLLCQIMASAHCCKHYWKGMAKFLVENLNANANLCFTIDNVLKQRCSTLSPFATCGDRLLKCGDNQNFFIFKF
jgi:hypothetical protein